MQNFQVSNLIFWENYDPQTKYFKQKFYKIQTCDIKLLGKGSSFFFLKGLN